MPDAGKLNKEGPSCVGHITSIVLLKFMFSKKATQVYKIFTVYLIFTTWCQIIGEDFINFCGLLRKNFTQQNLMNGFYYFFQEEEYFAHRL